MTYSDLGTAIDFKPNNYINGLCRKQFEVVNLSDPNWKQSLIENDDEEYFIMKREVIVYLIINNLNKLSFLKLRRI